MPGGLEYVGTAPSETFRGYFGCSRGPRCQPQCKGVVVSRRHSPALRKALRHLQQVVLAAAGRPGARLPTVFELARACGVASDTMRRAVGVLVDKGVLQARQRDGIRVMRGATALLADAIPRDVESGPGLAHEHIASCIRSDIQQGGFPPGEQLPTSKQLLQRYASSYGTVRKALEKLLAAGVLERAGRGYRPRLRIAARSRNTVFLIVRGADPDEGQRIGTWAPRNHQQYLALERACAMRNVSLQMHVYRYRGRDLVDDAGKRRMPAESTAREDVLGYLVWDQGLDGLDPPAYVADIAAHGKPVSVLTVQERHHYGPCGPGQVNVYALGTDRRCGEIMGEYLRELGHRRVAYIGDPESPRAYGIRAAFQAVGLHDAVVPAAPSSLLETAVRVSTDELGSYLARAADPGLPYDHATQRILSRWQARLLNDINAECSAAALHPLFEGLLTREDVTAWVANSDALALHVLRYLRSRDVAVPDTLSVVGFDDIEAAFIEGLTSYNFNVEAIVQAMLDHILHPGAAKSAQDGRVVVIDGFVKERETSRALDNS